MTDSDESANLPLQSSPEDEVPILELRNITKSFGAGQVLKGVDLVLQRGEVLGLVGENGAGKSTLLKIVSGVYIKDSGEMRFNGAPVELRDVAHSQQLGISVIYQELSLMPDLSAAENIFINRELTYAGTGFAAPLDLKVMREKTRQVLLDDLNTNIEPDKLVRDMTLLEQQMVEIARSIYSDAQVIIMDEPTASLGSEERDQLFRIIRRLKDRAHSIIFVSHHLDEVMLVCDRIMVLRDGNKVADGVIKDFTVDRIIREMIGKSVLAQYPKSDVTIGEPIFSVDRLTMKGVFHDISFDLHEGEILGIVGLEGCGKSEVLRSIFGCLAYDSGRITMRGRKLRIRNMSDAVKARVAFVPADRKTEGLFLNRDVVWNTTIASLGRFERYGTLSQRREREATLAYIDQLRIKADAVGQTLSTVSGGNQQKVLFSRWMMMDPDIFLLEEPTRGIDVNAKTEVYSAIGTCARNRKGVVVVSSEEEEVLGICDRIIVMRRGGIRAILDAKKTNAAEIKAYSVGGGDGK
jgi:ribose transport system ATP-binding protein